MTRTMYDAVTVSRIPADAMMVAGYVNGRYKNFDQLKARFPNAICVPIAVNITADATVLDVERYNATPTEAPKWCERQRVRGQEPTVYTLMSWWPDVHKAFKDQGIQEPQYWIAKWDNKPIMLVGAVAKQYGGQPGYDLSIVADYWPGVDTKREDLLMPAALNDDDARKCLIREWYRQYLGRNLSVEEHNSQLNIFRAYGADFCLAGILDSPEATAYRDRTPDTQ